MNTKVLSSYLLCVNMFGVPFSILDAVLNETTYVISEIQIMRKNGTCYHIKRLIQQGKIAKFSPLLIKNGLIR